MALGACGLLWIVWSLYWLIVARNAAEVAWKESWAARMLHFGPLVLIFYLFFGGDWRSGGGWLWIGTFFCAVGLFYSMLARFYLGTQWSATVAFKVDAKLIRTGPYRHIRHPIYRGILLAGAGTAFARGETGAWVGEVLLLATFVFKLLREEKVLRAKFGEEYEKYRRESWALFPGIW